MRRVVVALEVCDAEWTPMRSEVWGVFPESEVGDIVRFLCKAEERLRVSVIPA